MESRTLHRLIRKSCLLLLAGWMIYSFQRTSFYPFLLQLHPGTDFLNALPEFVKNNLPSLLHVWAMALLTAVAMPSLFLRKTILAPGLWLIVNVIFEWGQALDKNLPFLQKLPQALAHYFIQGRFDWLDLVACFLGACLASRTLAAAGYKDSIDVQGSSPFKAFSSWSRSLTAACTIFGLFSLMATSKHSHGYLHRDPFLPQYMSYEEFRASFAVLPAQPIVAPGKIYVKGDVLLINDINLGIHIIDNRNPATPLPLSFLKVLGSRDIAMFDHYLYVDSFVDFLVIDIEDPATPRLLQRVENIFPWQPEVWYPGQYVSDADPRKGVIVGLGPNTASSSREN